METIEKIEILETGQLIVVLASGGDPGYQYIYREAAEVSWDNALKAFKSPSPREWSYSDWFQHIVTVAGNFGIALCLTDETSWVNVPPQTKEEILKERN